MYQSGGKGEAMIEMLGVLVGLIIIIRRLHQTMPRDPMTPYKKVESFGEMQRIDALGDYKSRQLHTEEMKWLEGK